MKCSYCNKEFIGSKYQERQFRNNKNVFCSKSCGNLYRYKDDHLNISDEELKQKLQNMFNNTDLSYNEIKKACGVSQNRFTEIVQKYNIGRSKEKSNELKIKHMQETIQEKYNVNNIMKLQEYKNKIRTSHAKRTLEEKAKTSDQIRQTKLDKYNSETYNNREKAIATNLARYGVNSPVELEEVVKKRKEASLKKYGVDNPFNSLEVQEKKARTLIEKYGEKRALGNEQIREKIKLTNLKRYGSKNAFSNELVQQKQYDTIKDRYGVEYACQTENCRNASPKAKSKPNIYYKELLNPEKTEIPIEKYRYDMLKGNTLIEIDPTYTHNVFINPYGQPKERDYHKNKTDVALNNNYKCIHIFDWDDPIKIKNMFIDKHILYARELQLKEVDIETCSEFLNNYHLQNTCRDQTIRFGLYYKDTLIQIMTFGKPRYNKNYEWELLRLCTHKDYKVVGGAEKLFKHFVDIISPESIISYCDFSKFTGEVYNRLGFKKQGIAIPSKHWVKGAQHITDNLLRQRGYDQLFNTNYGKGTSNEELMLENGWLPIYDCGQLTFIWRKE